LHPEDGPARLVERAVAGMCWNPNLFSDSVGHIDGSSADGDLSIGFQRSLAKPICDGLAAPRRVDTDTDLLQPLTSVSVILAS